VHSPTYPGLFALAGEVARPWLAMAKQRACQVCAIADGVWCGIASRFNARPRFYLCIGDGVTLKVTI
jgi:hypothetical protein